jgi:hypothetical protein
MKCSSGALTPKKKKILMGFFSGWAVEIVWQQ